MISKETIEHLAKLARIKLTEKEEDKFTIELSSILDYVEKLNKIDTGDSKPIQQITGLENVMRKDEAKPQIPNTRYQILSEAPEKKDNYYKVPKILE